MFRNVFQNVPKNKVRNIIADRLKRSEHHFLNRDCYFVRCLQMQLMFERSTYFVSDIFIIPQSSAGADEKLDNSDSND
jgi:hypothetical protein